MVKWSWGGAAGGAASGAGTGAMFGPWGAAIGGVAGGLLGGLTGGGSSKKPKIKNYNLLTPEQQMAMQQYFGNPIQNNPLYQQGSSYLQNILSNNPEAFRAYEEPYLQNFEQNIAPGIAERFAGAGTGGGAMSSSALYNSLAQAGRNLQTDLAGQRANLQMQAAQQGLGYAQQPYSNLMAGLNIRAFQPYERPVQPDFLTNLSSGIFSGAGQGIGQGIGNYFSNKIGGGGTTGGV